ncbi:MAG: uroporphyrinogen-III synthase [Gammaproteobacteria bacterium]|nr:uroporphyrinogen-III synthase [Gammaproteobacteria bacterium]
MISDSLNGVNVLVTRPRLQQQLLSSFVESYGGVAANFPLMEIEPLTGATILEPLKCKLTSLNNYHRLIFVSTNAVEYGAKLINEFWPQLPESIDVIAIGPSTARMASAELACKVFHSKAGSSSADVLLLPQLVNVKDLKIAIVRGVGGLELLANTLRDRGAEVDYLEVYRRFPTHQPAEDLFKIIRELDVNVFSITSGESLEKLNELLLENNEPEIYFRNIPVVVPSDRLFCMAEQFGFKTVKLAKGADAESTIIALQELAIGADKIDSGR